MSLRLIIGGAGSGKTQTILEEIVAEVRRDPFGHPLWLLVPEQATFQAEQALCLRLGGIMRVRVVSFQRLAYLVMQHVAGATLTPINELGLTMLLRKVIEESKSELKPFARATRQVGFAAQLVEIVLQLKRQCIEPKHLRELLDHKGAHLSLPVADKLRDILIIYAKLQDTQHHKQILDSEDSIAWLARHVGDFGDIQGASIWLDGFTGFMPQEYAVLSTLIAMAEVQVSLSLAGELYDRHLADDHLFFPTWDTAQKLRHLARTRQAEFHAPLRLGPRNRYGEGSALTRIEKFFSEDDRSLARVPSTGLKVVAAATRRLEVDAAAREIVRLCREQGVRYREICLVVRDLAIYESLLPTTFRDYGIPIFIDQKRPIRHHPLLDLLRSSLSLVEDNFPYEAVMRCLKGGLFRLDIAAIDKLDNFLLATGFRGTRWLAGEDWVFRVPDDASEPHPLADELNALRREIVPHFADLHSKIVAGKTVHDFNAALFDLLERLGVAETIEKWAEESEAEHDVLAARLHTQVLGAVLDLLEQLEEILGTSETTLAEYAGILETGLEGLRLGLIPPSLDQVVVVEAGRSRAPEVEYALVLGLNDGIFPARAPLQGLFSDSEKESLAVLGLDLGSTARRKVYEEQFLLYTALTRAKRGLYLSYTVADEKGATLLPAVELKTLLSLFPDLRVQPEAIEVPRDSEDMLARLSHPRTTLQALGISLRHAKTGHFISPLWWDVYSHLLCSAEWRRETEQVAQALFYTNTEPPLAPEFARGAARRVWRGSVSRLEKFNACPFAYFSAFTLKLRERKIYKLAAVDIGNFYHLALEKFGDKLAERHIAWAELDEQSCRDISTELATNLQPIIQDNILTSTKRHSYLARKLQRVVERSALVLARHARQGRFIPLKAELGFGHGGTLPALTLTLADGTQMELTGRIDRVDTASGKEGAFIRIIDFKSGSNKLTPLEVYHGLRLQLLTYLEVALRSGLQLTGSEVKPAGALYFQVHDPLISANRPLSKEEAEEQLLLAFRTTGMVVADKEAIPLMDSNIGQKSALVPVALSAKDGSIKKTAEVWSAEQLSAMRGHLEAVLRQAGQAITSGDISIAPSILAKETACKYCEYKVVCQFDPLLLGNRYRELPKMKADEVWAALGVAESGDDKDVD